MVSTFTTARNLEKPAAGDQVGTWGTASINPDLDVIDAGMGQTATISGAAGNVVLAAAQFRCAAITLNSTLVGSIAVTFPTSFTGPYTIYNACSGSSSFIITMATTVAGGEVICAPPGELIDVFNDGTHLRYRNLERIGTLVPTMYSSMPAWVDSCTKKPYLNCDGSVISSASFPFLVVALSGTTLPDHRGRYGATLNQGTGRIQSSVAGVDGDTRSASGGITRLTSQHVPPVPVVLTDPLHAHAAPGGVNFVIDGFAGPNALVQGGVGFKTTTLTSAAATGISVVAGSTSPSGFAPPTVMQGITMIRSA